MKGPLLRPTLAPSASRQPAVTFSCLLHGVWVVHFRGTGDEGDSDSGEEGPHGHHQPGGPATGRNGAAHAAGGMSLDEEREAKRMRRLMRNRLSAHQARERRKQHQAEVNTISQQLHQRHAVLQDAVTVLTKENATLKALLRTVLPIQASGMT